MKSTIVSKSIARDPNFLKSKAKHKPIERHTRSSEPVFIYKVNKKVINNYVEKELRRNAYRYKSNGISSTSNNSNNLRKPTLCNFGKALN